MGIDLSRLGQNKNRSLTVPRDIFAALPKKPWPRLRLEQGEVLKAWYDRRTQRDVVVKQNTGGGKTVIGLLIAQSSLNEGVGPAVYLAPDSYLASQAEREARLIGLNTTTDPRNPDFLASQSILITTFQKLVNGRSTFGVTGSGRFIQSLGVVIVDDAHAALAITEKQFKVAVPATHTAFNELRALFAEGLKQQSPSAWHALNNNEPAAPIRVPFWTWQAHEQRVREILDPLKDDNELSWLFFAWPLVSQVLALCEATVTASEFEIRPPCPPIELIPAFAQATRRVYLTATLADDGVLVTELGAHPSDVAVPVTPERAADLGDRLILAPLALNPALDESVVRQLALDFSRGNRSATGENDSEPLNVIVLVPSDKRAALWSGYADLICHVGDLAGTVERLKAGEWLGVVVLVNKYDGVDLPGDACRLLIVDGVPFPLAPREAREASGLAGTDTFSARQVQKIEQGMGRGIRDAEDHCAVLLVGSELAMTLSSTKHRAFYSPATRAQIELSLELAQQIAREGIDAVRSALKLFLDRDGGWLAASSGAIAGIQYDQEGHVSDRAIARRRAFDLARAGQPTEASQTLIDGLRGIPPYEKGWFSEEAAAYQHGADPDRAQAILREARLANINVLMPLTAAPTVRLRASVEQAKAASEYLTGRYQNAVELVLGVTSLLDNIAFDPERTDAAEDAFEHLGKHIGFATERPDKLYKTGPDDLWVVDENTQLLIELKTGVTRTDLRIIKSELDQLSGHVSWHDEHYGADRIGIPVLVHPEYRFVPNGTPPAGTKVVTPTGVHDLKIAILAFARAVAVNQGWTSAERVRELLISFKLAGKNSILRFGVQPNAASEIVRAEPVPSTPEESQEPVDEPALPATLPEEDHQTTSTGSNA